MQYLAILSTHCCPIECESLTIEFSDLSWMPPLVRNTTIFITQYSHRSEIFYYIFTVSYVGEVGDISGQGDAKWRRQMKEGKI